MQKADAEGPAYPIASVDRALRLLLLVAGRSRIRLSDASQALGVAHSTAHRLLAMLVLHGFVRQEADHGYVPGPAMEKIARAATREADLRAMARPVIEDLAAAAGETVHLSVLDGRLVRYLDAVECTRVLRVGARTGRTVPAHYTAAGKALFAAMPARQVQRILAGVELEAATPRSVTDPRALARQLARIRRLGYAACQGESEEDVASIAVTVRDEAGRAVAAINVAGPVSRMDAARRAVLLDEVRRAADRLERALHERRGAA